MDYNGELRERVTNTGFATAVLGFTTAGAGVATFFGLRSLIPGSGVEAIVVPMVCALVIGVGLFCLWHQVISLVPLLHDPAKRTGGVMIGLILTLITIAISSWFIATSIGGDQAILAYMKSKLAHYENQLRTAEQNSLSERNLIPGALRVATELSLRAKAEESGDFTGKKGVGPAVRMLQRASDSYRELANQLELTGDEVDEYLTGAGKLIGKLHEIVGLPDGVSASNQQVFSEQVIALQQLLNKIDRTTFLPDVQNYGIISLRQKARSRAQERTLRNLESSMEKFTKRLSDEAKRVEKNRKRLEPVSYSPISAGMATYEYADEVAAAWAVGVGIDLMPMILLLLMMFCHAEAREPHVVRKPFFDVLEGGKTPNKDEDRVANE